MATGGGEYDHDDQHHHDQYKRPFSLACDKHHHKSDPADDDTGTQVVQHDKECQRSEQHRKHSPHAPFIDPFSKSRDDDRKKQDHHDLYELCRLETQRSCSQPSFFTVYCDSQRSKGYEEFADVGYDHCRNGKLRKKVVVDL